MRFKQPCSFACNILVFVHKVVKGSGRKYYLMRSERISYVTSMHSLGCHKETRATHKYNFMRPQRID